MPTPATWVDVALAAAIPLSIILVIAQRWKTGKGIGVRAIQFLAVATLVPGVILLAIRGLLHGEAVAAVFGGLAGYLFSNIAKFDDRADG